jgi:hypothetical protein
MTKQPRNEIDKFAEEMQKAMRETYRKVSKPKDRLIFWLLIGYFVFVAASVAQAVIYWSAR